MNELERNERCQKPKVCRLAKWSFGLSILGFCMCLTGFLVVPGLLTLVVGLFLGVVALIRIKIGRATLSGCGFAISGILISIISLVAFFCILHFISRSRPETLRLLCARNLNALGKVLRSYSEDFDGNYPPPDKWCDTLVEYSNIVEERRLLMCSGGKYGKCHYAINPNAKPSSPDDTVLLFETRPGWNQFGESEIIELENHRGIGGLLGPVKGCNILFNDGHVEFIKHKRTEELKWKVREVIGNTGIK